MRTKTYIAADFDHDKDAVDQLYYWKNNQYFSFDFQDAHDITQAYDTSLYCSIKSSLRIRLNESKTFVLIVGEHTDSITKGGCQFCQSYNSWSSYCARGGHNVDFRSYIEFECGKARDDYFSNELEKIVVLYKSTNVDRSKCPESVRYIGTHVPMIFYSLVDHMCYWDYQAVKKAIEYNN